MNSNIKLVFGDAKRIFINTSYGCSAKCKYCYLPSLDIDDLESSISYHEAINLVQEVEGLKKGRKGTILSIGCYSECWDKKNKLTTERLISEIAKWDNYIQFATKQQITLNELKILNGYAKFKNQIVVNISIPTISHSLEIEAGTAAPAERISILKYAQDYEGLYFVIYIKPVIEKITIEDIKKYSELMQLYNVPVVVGSLFKNYAQDNNHLAPIGAGTLYEYCSNELENIKNELKQYGNVYANSTDVIEMIRARKTKNETVCDYM